MAQSSIASWPALSTLERMSKGAADFDKILSKILQADSKLIDALDERLKATDAYREWKEHTEAYQPLPSESDIIGVARQRAKDVPAEVLHRVLREVLGACAALLEPVTIATAGDKGGLGHLAGRRHLGSSAQFHFVPTVKDVFDEVERKRCTYGVVPFETSTDGTLTATLYNLVESDARVCGEERVLNSYHLCVPTNDVTAIKRIYGTPIALAACERSLRKAYPDATLFDVVSGAVAASSARSGEAAAVVCTALVAELEQLVISRRRLEDEANNETRFVLIGHDRPARSGTDCTVLVAMVNNAPGVLFHVLRPFADRSLNLIRVESRSPRGPNSPHLFFIEMDGHMTDRAVLAAIEDVRAVSRDIKILGSYPICSTTAQSAAT